MVASRTEVFEQRKLVASLTQQLERTRTSGDRDAYIRLQGELSKTEIELLGAESQLQVLQKRTDDLLLLAPASGVVTTFQLAELLFDRPVRRGENVLQIADWSAPQTLIHRL